MQIPLHKIADPLLSSSEVNLYLLRLDLSHPHISGNKFFKLKYNIEEAKRQQKDTLLTFGGAYSNHIAATAAAGKEFGFKTIGIIRGDETREPSHTLKFAESCGMDLYFISREGYRKKDSHEFFTSFTQQFNNFYLLPEGGTNALAVKGCAEILSLIDIPFDYVCCPTGTGGTISGIIASLKENQKAIGIAVLKGGEFLKNDIEKFVLGKGNWDLNHDFHFGGYAKYTPELVSFIDDFEKRNNIPLDHVYTGKMMFGIYDLIRKGNFKSNETVVAIHTGGLQGKLNPLPNSVPSEGVVRKDSSGDTRNLQLSR